MNERQKAVADLCDGVKTSKQIAEILGEKHKYVQEVALKFDLPRRRRGSAFGSLNGSYKTGRKIDRDGYVLVSAPTDHPFSRKRKDRNTGVIYEHRLAMEKKLGRYLLPSETVDHIDGLRLHNCPSNLRLFDSNKAHLQETISGKIPKWSEKGLANIGCRHGDYQPVDSYNQMKKSGDARLKQILLALLSLGEDSPYLLGTRHHREKAGVFDLSHSNLKRELADLYQRYA